MRYFELQSQGFMIGSGTSKAACKTLGSQRLKQSGRRWATGGAPVGPQSLAAGSERFDEAWALVAATFQTEVTTLANVIALKSRTERRAHRTAASR